MMKQGTKKAVLYEITVNGVLTMLKFIAATLTHSAAMMNEAVHSLMDTLNQITLLIGLKSGDQPADQQYAFGHGQKKYLWNLWSAVGLFSIGCGVGLTHAWHAWKRLEYVDIPSVVQIFGIGVSAFWISAMVLIIAFCLEGYVLLIVCREFSIRMRAKRITNPWEYFSKVYDPTITAVLLEDTVAIAGIILAAAGIGLTKLTGSPLWDIGFSAAIAVMLGFTAIFLAKINMTYLTDIRDLEAEQTFREILQQHREIKRFNDLRSIILDDNHTLLVAEIELREEVILAQVYKSITTYSDKLMDKVLEEKHNSDVRSYAETRSIVQATFEYTEKITNELEAELKARCPQVFHVTIEVQVS
ncbi:MAG: cation diffusion facilitator family transporter [Gammaproteobacteria bacterium]|nr:cation diffusion facilitator family transporter [Gammaproteobacteria bacterium]